jgi:hypothetical protein
MNKMIVIVNLQIFKFQMMKNLLKGKKIKKKWAY